LEIRVLAMQAGESTFFAGEGFCAIHECIDDRILVVETRCDQFPFCRYTEMLANVDVETAANMREFITL